MLLQAHDLFCIGCVNIIELKVIYNIIRKEIRFFKYKIFVLPVVIYKIYSFNKRYIKIYLL